MTFTFPESSIPPLRDAPVLRWAILAPGWIATQFARSLSLHTNQVLAAVGSRSPERAADFAATFHIPHHGAYDDVAARSDIDAVYVAAPPREHRALALLAIEAGKHVLVEKPFTTTADEAAQVIAAARARGVFVMEAMWTAQRPVQLATQDDDPALRATAPPHRTRTRGPGDPASQR